MQPAPSNGRAAAGLELRCIHCAGHCTVDGATNDKTKGDRQVTWIKGKFPLVGIRKLLLPRPGGPGRIDASAIAAGALFGSTKPASGQTGSDLVNFLKQVHLFEDLKHGELTRLA